MRDDSALDGKYFTSADTYNCPFCNRRNVRYAITNSIKFDWTDTKPCWAHFARCSSCSKTSLHLTYSDVRMERRIDGGDLCFYIGDNISDIDAIYFYSVPRTFFVMDQRIPRRIRDLFDEAEGCLKSNFLTGASACARKLVYEVAKDLEAEGDSYEDRIKSLKAKLPQVDSSYFDTLVAIQQTTSDKVHENAYDGWSARHLRLILATIQAILVEVYVLPKQREERHAAILELKQEVLGSKEERTAAHPEQPGEKPMAPGEGEAGDDG